MVEHNTNILHELRPWHVLTARCSRCGRQGEVQRRWLGRARTIEEVERRLCCAVCLNRTGNSVTVTVAPR